jgi:DNA damage-binding protein 2
MSEVKPAIVLETIEPPFSSIKSNGKSPFGTLDRNRLYLSQLAGFKVKRSISYFDRRVTCIEWHPSNEFPTVMALGSKGGDICWFDLTKNPQLSSSWNDKNTNLPYIYGQGAGGSITAMRFNPFDPTMIFTTSIDGTVKQQDFEGKQSIVYLDTLNKDKWFTAIDISASRKIMAIGANYGQMILKDFDGNGNINY